MSVKDNLVAHYTMDDIMGQSLKDETGYHGGVIDGTPTQVDGKLGKALDFDTTVYVSLPLAVLNQDNGTWCAWINVDTNAGNVRIFSSDHTSGTDYEYRTYCTASDSQFHFYVGNGTSVYNTYITLVAFNEWEHVCFTWEYDNPNTILKAYYNGDYQRQNSFSGKIQVPDIDIEIGSWNHVNKFDGKVDDFRIYNVTLSGTVADIYNLSEQYFSGYVYEQGSPVARTLYLHNRDGGDLMDTTTSSGNGYYYLETIVSGSHYIVCLDDSAGEDYNDLIIGDIYPTNVFG